MLLADATSTTAATPNPTPPPPSIAARNPARWIHSAGGDLALALCWVPFVVVAALLPPGPGLNTFITAVFVLSFAHQPLTLALIYGDREQFRIRRGVFSFSPIVFAVAVYAAVNVNVVLLAVIGGLWNAEHTLMQRYGLTRIYGRKAGQDEGRQEKVMLFSFLVLALVAVGADPRTPERLAAVDIGDNNRMGVEVLAQLRPVAVWLLVPALAVALLTLGQWVVAEVRRARAGEANPGKWLYIGATVALFALVPFNPVAALMGYVGAHSLEYFVIVHQSLGRRYVTGADPAERSPLGRAVRARPGRAGFLAAYLGVIIAVVTVLQFYGSAVLYAVVFFTLGGLHVFYDGFIWKLRRDKVAASLAIPTA